VDAIKDKLFSGEAITLDGKAFIRCTFTNCRLIVRGTALFGFSESKIEDSSTVEFEDAALITVQVLRGFLAGGAPYAQIAEHALRDPEAFKKPAGH
jgi:hypothetical protein